MGLPQKSAGGNVPEFSNSSTYENAFQREPDLDCAPPYNAEEQRIIDARSSITALSGMDPLCMIHNMRVLDKQDERKSIIMETRKQPQPASALDVQVGGGHYKKLKIQPIEYCEANRLGACESAIIKYITRWRKKGGLEDLKKIKHYVDLLIETEAKYHQWDSKDNSWGKDTPAEHHPV